MAYNYTFILSFPDSKFRTIDTWQDAQTLWRQVANLALKPLHFRDSRPYLLAEKLEFEQNVENDADSPEEINVG